MYRTDEAIKKDVVDSLYWDTRVDASKVEVTVEDQMVTLKGQVPTARARRASIEDSGWVRGVVGIAADLSVELPPIPSDREIKESLDQSIAWDMDFDDSKITVSVADGLVTLEGAVEEHWKRVALEDMAASHAGVWEVKNKLTVVPTEDILDEVIASDIDAALERSALVDRDDIQVEVADGVVTLRGAVPSLPAETAARSIAQYTGGVRDVINELQIAIPA